MLCVKYTCSKPAAGDQSIMSLNLNQPDTQADYLNQPARVRFISELPSYRGRLAESTRHTEADYLNQPAAEADYRNQSDTEEDYLNQPEGSRL